MAKHLSDTRVVVVWRVAKHCPRSPIEAGKGNATRRGIDGSGGAKEARHTVERRRRRFHALATKSDEKGKDPGREKGREGSNVLSNTKESETVGEKNDQTYIGRRGERTSSSCHPQRVSVGRNVWWRSRRTRECDANIRKPDDWRTVDFTSQNRKHGTTHASDERRTTTRRMLEGTPCAVKVCTGDLVRRCPSSGDAKDVFHE